MLEWLEELLPLRAVVVELKFTATARFQLYHAAAVSAFVRTLITDIDDFADYLWIDAPESGGIFYQINDRYRFVLYGLNHGSPILTRVLGALQNLPHSVRRDDPQMPLRNNVELVGCWDLFSGQSVQTVDDLSMYGIEELIEESNAWKDLINTRIRWITPIRMLRDKSERETVKGEARFCRQASDLSYSLLYQRLYDTFAGIARRNKKAIEPRSNPQSLTMAGDIFWVDAGYRDAASDYHSMGGVQGLLEIQEVIPPEQLILWVLGQYVGIGQRRAFGWGRYRLEDGDGSTTMPRISRSTFLLAHIATQENLRLAFQQVSKSPPTTKDLERLEKLRISLINNDYRPSALEGMIVDEELIGKPPFWDRVAQRACVQVLTVGLEPLFKKESFNKYLKNKALYANHWQSALHLRLQALWGDDPLVSLLLAWMTAPILYQHQWITNDSRFPRSAPLSPLFAKLLGFDTQ